VSVFSASPIPPTMTALLTQLFIFPKWTPVDADTIKSHLISMKAQMSLPLSSKNHLCGTINSVPAMRERRL
jgi:hypothetical protein